MVAFIGHVGQIRQRQTLAGEAEFAGGQAGLEAGAGLKRHQQVGHPAAIGPQGHPEPPRGGFIGEPFAVTAASHITSIAGLTRQKIGVNGTNSIGTLLTSALLQENGISLGKVEFITDPKGYPAMPRQLQTGSWGAALLAEPYVTIAEQDYGDQELADMDQAAKENLPMDGYVATQAWAEEHPKTAAAFVRAIEEGQTIAATEPPVVRAAIAKADDLPSLVTVVMALPGFPTGPVNAQNIQRVAEVMREFGVLGKQYGAEVEDGTLTRSMIS